MCRRILSRALASLSREIVTLLLVHNLHAAARRQTCQLQVCCGEEFVEHTLAYSP
jgi:hypothetical protein